MTIARTSMFVALAISSVFSIEVGAYASSAEIEPADKAFMAESARAGIAEVRLGKLAKKHASSTKVKEFANEMIKDHKKANKELKKVASKNNMTLPNEVNGTQYNNYERISKLRGTAFDRAYIDQAVADHKQVASSLKKKEDTKDANLRNWVDTTLPVVEHHLDMANDLNKVY